MQRTENPRARPLIVRLELASFIEKKVDKAPETVLVQ
jgi:hypothetical protein